MAKKTVTKEDLIEIIEKAVEEREALLERIAELEGQKDPTRTIKELRKEVLRERIQGLEAQIELGRVLKEKAEAELAALGE